MGSITSLTDETGNVVQEYKYDSFGNITYIKDISFIQPFTFTGREYDPETGLYFYRERTLNSRLGIFHQEDPIGFAGGDVNLYRYVGNNPVNFVDPLGLLLADPNASTGQFPRRNSSQTCVYGCHPPSPAPKPPQNWTKEQKMRVCEMNCHLACEAIEHACGVHDISTSMSTCALGCFYFCHFLIGD